MIFRSSPRALSYLLAFPLVLSIGCSGDGSDSSSSDADDGGMTSGGMTSGDGGSTNTGGTATGGSSGGSDFSSGGSLGSGGSPSNSGGAPTLADEHCEPGDSISGFFLFSGTMTNCDDWDPGNPSIEYSSARSIELPSPMTANEPYALSFDYLSPGAGELVYYATEGECGPVLEELSREEMANRDLICTDTRPSGDYTHLVMVWNQVSASLSDGTFCPNMTCK